MAVMCVIPSGVASEGIVTWAAGSLDKIQNMLAANASGTINIEDYWAIGDIRSVTYSGTASGTSTSDWVITDFNGTSSGGTTYSAVIHTKTLLSTSRYMNSSNTNVGGWNNCYMRNTVMSEIFAVIPSDFKALIKEGSHISGAGNATDQIQTTNDYLFLFSEREVQGVRTYSGSLEYDNCKQFEYFTIAGNKQKTGNGGSYPGCWWLRSPCVSNATSFCRVNPDGSANAAAASNLRGVAAAALI